MIYFFQVSLFGALLIYENIDLHAENRQYCGQEKEIKMPKRGENIYKRKDGRWEGRITIHSSHPKRKSVYGRTYREVKEKIKTAILQKTEVDVATSHFEPTLVSEAIDAWIKFKSATLKQSSIVKYRNLANKYIMPYWGDKSIGELNNGTIASYLEQLVDRQMLLENTISHKTVRDILMIISNVISYQTGECMVKPKTMELNIFKQKRKEIVVLSSEEQRKLENILLGAPTPQKLGVELCLYTGLRLGEICALKWENIDLDKKCLRVCLTMQRLQNSIPSVYRKTSIIETPPKTFHSMRNVPIADFLIPLLKDIEPSSHVSYFLTGNDRFIEPRQYENIFKRILTDAGLDNYKFHILRHTFATRCVESGLDTKSLSEILGHSSIKITLDRYAHPSFESKVAGVNKLVNSRHELSSNA